MEIPVINCFSFIRLEIQFYMCSSSIKQLIILLVYLFVVSLKVLETMQFLHTIRLFYVNLTCEFLRCGMLREGPRLQFICMSKLLMEVNFDLLCELDCCFISYRFDTFRKVVHSDSIFSTIFPYLSRTKRSSPFRH